MTEAKEREAYRMKGKYYGVEGNRHKQSVSCIPIRFYPYIKFVIHTVDETIQHDTR